jgi:hypothetical protein
MEVLRTYPEHVADLAAAVDALLAAPLPATSADRLAWFTRLEDAILVLVRALPERGEDYDAGRMFEFSVALRRAIEVAPDGEDPGGGIELAALSIGDVARRVRRRLEHDALDEPRVAADFVLAALPSAGAGELGRLLGVSTKTIGAWRAGRPVTRNADRVVLTAQVLTHLRASMSPRGMLLWFDAPRAQLDGRTPLELLDRDGPAAAREPLTALARGLRGQLAD